MAKTHKPPSRERYEQSHPTVSCRVSRDTYDKLKNHLNELGDISFADFVKDALGELELKIPKAAILEKARLESRTQTVKEHQIWYYCSVCRQRMNIAPNGPDHKALIGYLKEHGWGHGDCVNSKS